MGYETLIIETLRVADIRDAYFENGVLYVPIGTKDAAKTAIRRNGRIINQPHLIVETGHA